ncbi:alpha-ketoglutarate-dependent dioxygenase AlkB [Shinella sp. 838]|jgi:alkylated DNA repair dioxygenase AlkB|uniref:alpha-ketoglutarate-dependent dioxygenase AlkB n=1 Tax=unclassified Shinella TaxID=2643062 RepID=UPI0003C53F0E|nr:MULTISPECIES: alpha-ketoglutarate-dependent dioxygenase AlkB [unclassified Shinella]EYR83381.1 alkylated DNA repair protein [Shinella sp. DD12]MCA0341007.1 alpha-ketoglutarate-dependent dioxygenase AlkB [Pseudomonadota bacterium]MDG4672134.1 alpha-ketoglutarate-dependent dioxygenase AlkB [Shinella sp. 838]
MDHALDAATLPPGATYIPEFLSREEEEAIKDQLDAGEWSNTLKRRVRHFGYLYDYRARAVSADAYLGKLPPWLETFAERLVTRGYFVDLPDQVIANEYLPGQGISAHVDCVPCFDDTIISISLLSQCEMIFRERSSSKSLAVLLHPRSGILLKGAGRYDWTHEIPARKSDVVDDTKVNRGRRISLTFRKVIQATGKPL